MSYLRQISGALCFTLREHLLDDVNAKMVHTYIQMLSYFNYTLKCISAIKL